jgi:peptide/nickel transport system substrate-binding protein
MFRRLLLMVTILALFTFTELNRPLRAQSATYQEAPALAELVKAGKLPPVEKRLPEKPLVIDPVEEVGQYGGTWHMLDSDNTLGWTRQTVMVEPFLKWKRDSSGFRPNLLESWEWNKDATELVAHFVKGIKWSDGEPLTVDDYLFWWNDMGDEQGSQRCGPQRYNGER